MPTIEVMAGRTSTPTCQVETGEGHGKRATLARGPRSYLRPSGPSTESGGMVLFKANTRMHSDAATLAAGNAAMGLWFRCGCWSAENHRDGFIPGDIARMYAGRGQVEALVAVGLWIEVGDGYQMDWTGNLDADLREKRRAAGSRGGAAAALARAMALAKQELQQNPSNPLASATASASDLLQQELQQTSRAIAGADTRAVPTRDLSLGTYGEGSLETLTPDSDRILPESRCPQHIETPATGPCAACGDARRTHTEAAREARRADARRRSMEAHAHADIIAAEIARCTLCDDRGYTPGGNACAHDPGQSQRAADGLAAVRQALQKGNTPP